MVYSLLQADVTIKKTTGTREIGMMGKGGKGRQEVNDAVSRNDSRSNSWDNLLHLVWIGRTIVAQ